MPEIKIPKCPGDHPNRSVFYLDGKPIQVVCVDCKKDLSHLPEYCRHVRIDNSAGLCTACEAQMLSVKIDTKFVKSSENAAACRNPACLKAIANKTYDSENPPEGCTNRDGVYVPDCSSLRDVPIAYEYTYECDRCRNEGAIFDGGRLVFECGRVHRGDPVPLPAGS